MSLSQQSSNRYLLTLRLNITNEAEKKVIERLQEIEGTAHRGYMVDAITAYMNDGEPMPRQMLQSEQLLMIKSAIREEFNKMLADGNFLSVVSEQSGVYQSDDSEFVQENPFDDLIDEFGGNVIKGLSL